jgi:hypothetical protein
VKTAPFFMRLSKALFPSIDPISGCDGFVSQGFKGTSGDSHLARPRMQPDFLNQQLP